MKNNMHKFTALFLSTLILISFTSALSLSDLPIVGNNQPSGGDAGAAKKVDKPQNNAANTDSQQPKKNSSGKPENITDRRPENVTGKPEFVRLLLKIDRGNYRSQAISNMGGKVRYNYDTINAIAIEVPEQAAERLKELDFVEEVEEDRETRIIPPQPDNDTETDNNDSQTDEQLTGEGVSIAVIDTGIDDTHQAFEGDIEFQKDFTGGDDPYDYNGHGTHVASIALGNDEENPGVAPDAQVMNLKVLNENGTGRMSDVMAGIDTAVQRDAEVMVLSLGAEVDNCDGTDMLSQTVDNAVDQDVAAAVAAGNNGPETGTITIPGCSKRGFAAGATGINDESVADYSSRGPTSDGRIKPDVVAPGTAIEAAEAGTDGYTTKSGTSMAAPYLAGNLALLVQAKPDSTPSDYYNAIEETANDLDASQYAQGEGRVDVNESIQYFTDYNSSDGTTENTTSNQTETNSTTTEQETNSTEIQSQSTEEETQNNVDESSDQETENTSQQNSSKTQDNEGEQERSQNKSTSIENNQTSPPERQGFIRRFLARFGF